MKSAFENAILVGVSRGGNDFLIADADDPGGAGQIVFSGVMRVSDVKTVAIWTKWRVWESPTDADRDRIEEILSGGGGAEKALIAAMVGTIEKGENEANE